MAFLAERPISVINPIWAYILLAMDGKNVSISIAPNIPMGTASSTENGTAKLSYNAAKNRNTNSIDSEKI